jgi:pilus assembly protein CpaB
MNVLSRVLDRLDRIHRRFLWHRRPLAALAAAAAAYIVIQAATAPPPQTVQVWTAARDLPNGTVLDRTDLVRHAFTPSSVPRDQLRSAAQVLGRTLAAPVGQGMPLTTDAVVADGWLAHRPGLSAVPLRITDPSVVGLLTVGDRVSLVATDPQRPGRVEQLVSDATVLAIPRSQSGPTGGLQGRLVVFGVPPEAATGVAAISASQFLTVVWNQ